MATIWLTKLILAHLLTDFFLQPRRWVQERKRLRFRSQYLYLHTVITAAVAWLFIGWAYAWVALVILVTHTVIDGWKAYQPEETRFFLIDQALHLLVILCCWWISFFDLDSLVQLWQQYSSNTHLLMAITALVFLSYPSGILVGQLTRKWSQAVDKTGALQHAGKWIGIIERLIIFVLVLQGQYEAIGLLIAAKGVIRFADSDRTERKTEYLLIGTLISFSLAIITGLLVLRLTA